MRRWLKWMPGRQSADYRKLLLWEFSWRRFNKAGDAYILEYPPHAHLPPHTDPVQKGRHYRINVELQGHGEFKVAKTIFKFGPIVMFRPDLMEHEMINGPALRRILSIGFLL